MVLFFFKHLCIKWSEETLPPGYQLNPFLHHEITCLTFPIFHKHLRLPTKFKENWKTISMIIDWKWGQIGTENRSSVAGQVAGQKKYKRIERDQRIRIRLWFYWGKVWWRGQDLNLRPSGYETVRHLVPLLSQKYSYFWYYLVINW